MPKPPLGGRLQKQRRVLMPPVWFRLLVITPIVYMFCLVVTILSPLLHLLLDQWERIDTSISENEAEVFGGRLIPVPAVD